MREIDPQSETRLTEALRRLAASSPQSASPQLGAGLLGEFRRYHTRRRRIRRTATTALVACLALAVSLVFTHKSPQQSSQSTGRHDTTAGVPEKQASPPAPVAGARPPNTGKTPKLVSTKPKGSRPQTVSANRTFLALPGYDPAVPVDELHVVRVQLPASALWKVGAPVTADSGSRRMTADFVVSQDGTPFAVRLVQ
ncbi:MAG TPA: hypothetical protein VIB39_00655 [Candidatus Angelobacter sp.]|jgi:hypothetical protein